MKMNFDMMIQSPLKPEPGSFWADGLRVDSGDKELFFVTDGWTDWNYSQLSSDTYHIFGHCKDLTFEEAFIDGEIYSVFNDEIDDLNDKQLNRILKDDVSYIMPVFSINDLDFGCEIKILKQDLKLVVGNEEYIFEGEGIC